MAQNQQSFVIPLSSKRLLQEKLGYIERGCDVKIICLPNGKEDDNVWVNVMGRSIAKVLQAKTYVISVCSPETTERVAFSGFPACIFESFECKCKQAIEMDCGVYMNVTGKDEVLIQGSNISVTMATSKIFHLHKLLEDKTCVKGGPYVQRFNQLISEDQNKDTLLMLSNSFKKEIISLIITTVEISDSSDAEEGTSASEVILIEDSTISISSDSDEVLSDDSEQDDPTRPEDPTVSHILPPTFVIVEWVKTHYIATNNTTDYVAKSDLLEHFRTHFDLQDHPNLSSEFYNKLAASLFAGDRNYRSVKSTRRKKGKRKLTCLKRRSTSKEPSANTAHSSENSSKRIMKEWNANRGAQTQIKKLPEAAGTSKPCTVAAKVKPVVAMPMGIPVPPRPLQSWLDERPPMLRSTEYNAPRATPATSTMAHTTETKAAQISKMNNQQLIRSPRPPINPSLRPVVIDGSNVAMAHGNHKMFSCRGIAICVRYFMQQGHEHITCFVPNYRKGNKGKPPTRDAHLLVELENMGFVKSTPSRMIGHTNVVCYDDRFIVELAAANNGVILSNDQYRDLMAQDRRWKPVVERQLLLYTMVGDLLMLPEDPLGRNGPTLSDFMRLPNYRGENNQSPQHHPTPMPPSLPSVPQAWLSSSRMPTSQGRNTPRKLPSVPQARLSPARMPISQEGNILGSSPAKTTATTLRDEERLVQEMLKVFPERDSDIRKVVSTHPRENDITRLMNYMLLDQGND